MNIGYWTCENCGGCTDHHEPGENEYDLDPVCNHCGDDLFDREYTPMPPPKPTLGTGT